VCHSCSRHHSSSTPTLTCSHLAMLLLRAMSLLCALALLLLCVQVWCEEPPRASLPLPQEPGYQPGGATSPHPGTTTGPGEQGTHVCWWWRRGGGGEGCGCAEQLAQVAWRHCIRGWCRVTCGVVP
jgi:hypothetical protein